MVIDWPAMHLIQTLKEEVRGISEGEKGLLLYPLSHGDLFRAETTVAIPTKDEGRRKPFQFLKFPAKVLALALLPSA